MSRKFLFMALGVLALLLIACGGAPNAFGEGVLSAEGAEPVKGSPAPNFELQTAAGETVRLSDFTGQPVLINFWATWCAPCRIEMPDIQEKFEQHSPDLVVLAVDFDESAQDVIDFANELELSFDPLLDPGGKVQELYQVRGYPSTYFVDRQGVIQVVHIGLMTSEQLDGYLEVVGLPGAASQ